MFLQMNRNKRGLTLDPMTETGRKIVRRLVATADVVVANLPPATLKAMGLDYESLAASKPDIILTTVSAFGHGGPYSERTGFDGVAQSMVGAAYLTGHPEEPVKSYAPWVDFGTASLSAFGTMAALMERAQSGRRQVVEGSLLLDGTCLFQLSPDRAATPSDKPCRHREPLALRGARRHRADEGRLDPRAGDRHAALQALGTADGRGGAMVERSPLQGRPFTWRSRRTPFGADAALGGGTDDRRGPCRTRKGAHSSRPRLLAATGARRSAHKGNGLSEAARFPGPAGSGARHGDAAPSVANALPRCADAHRCSANILRSSSANSAARRKRSLHSAPRSDLTHARLARRFPALSPRPSTDAARRDAAASGMRSPER